MWERQAESRVRAAESRLGHEAQRKENLSSPKRASVINNGK
jgi:hypothetical protein